MPCAIGGQKLGRKSPEEPSQVVHVANQHTRRVVVARRVHRLRRVDEWHRLRRPYPKEITPSEDGSLSVAMHDAGTQHANNFADETAMQVDRDLRR